MKYKIECIDGNDSSISYICDTDMHFIKASDGLIILDESEQFKYVHAEKYITDKKELGSYKNIKFGTVIHKLFEREEQLIWKLIYEKAINQIKYSLQLQEEGTELAEEIYGHISQDIDFNNKCEIDRVRLFDDMEEAIDWLFKQDLLNTETLINIESHPGQSIGETICNYFEITELKNGNCIYIDQ